ncbi:MAG TPA: response regulator [Microvirga sp.]|nr:response regulator [Microvirga sp.]
MMHDRAGTLQIALVDDDPAVRESLATAFERDGFRVRVYDSGRAFLHESASLRPDCLLLGAEISAPSGFEVLDAIGGGRYPAPVIMISRQGDVPTAVAAIKAGAHDFIEKPFDADAVVYRVREAVRAYRERPPADGFAAGWCPRAAEALTAREREVLDQIVHGASNKEAGRTLGISPRTVEVHRARIMEKLRARNTADLMRIVLSSSDRT